MKLSKSKVVYVLILICLISLVLLSGNRDFLQKHEAVSEVKGNNSNEYILGAHYFGNEWPITFWTSEFYNLDSDMQKIRNDGFNTIVLVIPWGEFQPGIDPIKYNDDMFERLKYVVNKADLNDLKVIIRIGYAWDFDPDVQYPNNERFEKLYVDDLFYKAWLDYITKIKNELEQFHNVTFAFLTWEDFWGIVEKSTHINSLDERIKYAKEIGYQNYLKNNYDLNEISKLYNQSFESFDQIPTPDAKKESMRLMYEFFDYILIEKFYIPAKERFGNLSLEVRVDSDPVYNSDGSISWYSHNKTYNLPDSSYTTMYYSPSMGAENNSNEEPSDKVLNRFDYILNNTKQNAGDNKIFIDQFLYFDNTPAFSHNTKIKSNELSNFIGKSYNSLTKYTSGYALWNYKDYAANTVYNAAFEFGLKGWDSNNVKSVKNENDSAVEVSGNGWISQTIPKSRDFYHSYSEYVNLKFSARAVNRNSTIKLSVGEWSEQQSLVTEWKDYNFKIPVSQLNKYDLKFSSINGEFILDDIYLYSFIQKGQVYDVNGNSDALLDSIKELNQKLSLQNDLIPVYEVDLNKKRESQYITDIFDGSSYIEEDDNGRYVWIGKNSEVQIKKKANSTGIEIKGYVPFSLHRKYNDKVENIVVELYVNNKKVKEYTFTKDSPLSIKLMWDEIDDNSNIADIQIRTNSEFNPSMQGESDRRNLSIIINSITQLK
ncbi:glycoside hydrolase family 5 protein [Paenibacillus sp. KQZ6P-2]|uniref:Glycoside hydrolase family 5 protein n=1 Tax=Paenibacillus mangrovi TaxID=2931978 RepID=A0A9X1WPI0_9BACL|nr:cellulase family glycosylhydrolase [Paenibacillus mangrovi]MCJ8012683.1 glycoside hydrolase family 5 protein [Paenibacillus mangrovi]